MLVSFLLCPFVFSFLSLSFHLSLPAMRVAAGREPKSTQTGIRASSCDVSRRETKHRFLPFAFHHYYIVFRTALSAFLSLFARHPALAACMEAVNQAHPTHPRCFPTFHFFFPTPGLGVPLGWCHYGHSSNWEGETPSEWPWQRKRREGVSVSIERELKARARREAGLGGMTNL